MTLYKAMGYGLAGLQCDDDGNLIDPRINTSSILLDWDREDEATVRNYVHSTLENKADLDTVLKGWLWGHVDPDSTDPFDAVENFSDTDLEGALLLRPVGTATGPDAAACLIPMLRKPADTSETSPASNRCAAASTRT
jgi:hypothetical protein